MNYQVLSQRDPQWANKKLGFSNYTIGSHGCTLTALTVMLNRLFSLNLTPDEVNIELKKTGNYDAKNNPDGAFSGALVVWANVAKVYKQLKWVRRDWNYSNPLVAWYVYIKKLPVLVEVNAAKIGAPRHWVLYIGNRLCVDPWVGKVVSTATYPATGDAIYTKSA